MDHNVKINPELSKNDFFTTMTMLGKRSVQLLLVLVYIIQYTTNQQSTNSCLDVDCQQFQSPMVDFYLPCGLNEEVCLPWSPRANKFRQNWKPGTWILLRGAAWKKATQVRAVGKSQLLI